MNEPTLKERLIQDILNMSNDQVKAIDKMITEYKRSLIPYDDEPLTAEEEQAIKEAEDDLKNGQTVSYDEVFGNEELSEEEKQVLREYNAEKMKFEDVDKIRREE